MIRTSIYEHLVRVARPDRMRETEQGWLPVIVLVVVSIAGQAVLLPANATCSIGRVISGCGAGCSYVYSPGHTYVNSGFNFPSFYRGSFWGLHGGNPAIGAGDDNGTDLPSGNADAGINWLVQYAGFAYLSGAWSTAGVDGCVDNPSTPSPKRTAVLLTDQSVDGAVGFVSLQCVQADVLGNFFYQWGDPPVTLAPIPSPRVLGFSRASQSAVDITVSSPLVGDVDAGIRSVPSCGTLSEQVLGYRTYSRSSVDGTSPNDRLSTAGWTARSAVVPLGQSTSLSVPVAPGGTAFLATSIVFEGGFETAHLSQDVSICPDAASEDVDHDGYFAGCGDCNDGDPQIHRGAVELCNGLDDDCDAQIDEGLPAHFFFRDADGDGYGDSFSTAYTCHKPPGYATVSGDCNDSDPLAHPGASEICNGADDDCDNQIDEGLERNLYRDADGDGYGDSAVTQFTCASPAGWSPQPGDCDDTRASVHPGASEICDAIDENCDGRIDEDNQGIDSDGDGIHNVCDNCRFAYNTDQLDSDGDHAGNSCDNCVFASNPAQADIDSDGRGDVCDNCGSAYNPLQDDTDRDAVGDACDNCGLDFNPGQGDIDHDNAGDVCDLNDGRILILYSDGPDYIEWQEEAGFTSWNVYEGDLDVLKGTGVYTQNPGSNPLAEQRCGEPVTYVDDFGTPPVRKAVFSLVTGVQNGVEGSLGLDSEGAERPNANPCP